MCKSDLHAFAYVNYRSGSIRVLEVRGRDSKVGDNIQFHQPRMEVPGYFLPEEATGPNCYRGRRRYTFTCFVELMLRWNMLPKIASSRRTSLKAEDPKRAVRSWWLSLASKSTCIWTTENPIYTLLIEISRMRP